MKLSFPFRSLKFLPRLSLGIDIGTSAIKIVELSFWAGRKSLKNYGELKASAVFDKPFRTFEKNTLLLSSSDIARAIRAILQEAKISTKNAVFSLPDFSSFFTHFTLPPMTREELPEAVSFEARKYVPLPLSEVIIDWQVIQGRIEEKQPLKILMVAVPREVVNQYQEIANLAGLELIAIEAEVFGCIRSLVQDTGPVIVIDIGAQSTTVNVVFQKSLYISYSLDIAGNNFTERIAQSLSIEKKNAEELKLLKGIQDPNMKSILLPLLDILFREVETIANQFSQKERKEIEKIILAGGTALLPGFQEYVQNFLGKTVEIANPFRNLFYPPILEETLKSSGPAYAVAVGTALRGFE